MRRSSRQRAQAGPMPAQSPASPRSENLKNPGTRHQLASDARPGIVQPAMEASSLATVPTQADYHVSSRTHAIAEDTYPSQPWSPKEPRLAQPLGIRGRARAAFSRVPFSSLPTSTCTEEVACIFSREAFTDNTATPAHQANQVRQPPFFAYRRLHSRAGAWPFGCTAGALASGARLL